MPAQSLSIALPATVYLDVQIDDDGLVSVWNVGVAYQMPADLDPALAERLSDASWPIPDYYPGE